MQSLRTLVATVGLAGMTAFPSHAAVVFDNFGPNNQSSNFGYLLGGFEGIGSPGFEYAAAFTVTGGSLYLNYIELPLTLFAGVSVFNVRVYDSAAGLPNATLASRAIAAQLPPYGTPGAQPQQVSFQQTVLLESGRQYWFAATVPSATTSAYWMQTTLPQIPVDQAVRFEGGGWFSISSTPVALRIVASPVPEAPPSVLLWLGLAALAYLKRRQHSVEA